MRTPICILLAALLLGACSYQYDRHSYRETGVSDSSYIIDTLNVDDFHTIVADGRVDIHYTSQPGPAQIIISGPASRLDTLNPHVENGVLFMTNHWMETSPLDREMPKCTVVAHSPTLKGIGTEQVALGHINQLLKKNKVDSTFLFALFCHASEWDIRKGVSYSCDTFPFVYATRQPSYGMTLEIHKKGDHISLDLTTDTMPDEVTLRSIPVVERTPMYRRKIDGFDTTYPHWIFEKDEQDTVSATELEIYDEVEGVVVAE